MNGAAAVGQALLLIGWGIIPIALYHLMPLWASTMSWRAMLPAAGRPSIAGLTWVRWIRESINTLLPVGQVGGDLVAVRLSYAMGVSGPYAAGSMVVDLTVGVLTQIVFVLIGLALLLAQSTDAAVLSVVWGVLIGMGVFIVAIAAFFFVQRAGIFGLVAKVGGALIKNDSMKTIAGRAGRIDDAVRAIYRDRAALVRACAWRLVGWIVGTGEIYLILYFLGHPVSLAEAMILESLGQGVKAAAFLVPGALGVLEGSFIIFGAMFGIGAELSLAVALAKRVRELLLGLPGLLAWQMSEGRRLLKRRG